jgi:hypothetical protein
MGKYREPDYWLPSRQRREIWKEVKALKRDSMTENRRIRRKVRTEIRTGTINNHFHTPIEKPGKYFANAWKSSGAFKRAYSYARSEAEFYDVLRYADY